MNLSPIWSDQFWTPHTTNGWWLVLIQAGQMEEKQSDNGIEYYIPTYLRTDVYYNKYNRICLGVFEF